jgi:subtilisin family serine protease
LKKLGIVFVLSVILLFGTFSTAMGAVNSHANENSSKSPVTIPDSYIVVLNDGFSPQDVAKGHGLAPNHIYKKALNGFSATMSSVAAEKLNTDTRVKYVEQDKIYTIAAQTLPTGIDRINADTNPLAKIDGSDERNPAVIAVIDTGVDRDHPDLNVDQGYGFECEIVIFFIQCYTGGAYGDDVHDHGTHVAGIAAALDNGIGAVGVAPGASIVPVRVLEADGSGSLSVVLAGIDYVTLNSYYIDVANMSLTGGFSQAFNDAVAESVGAGVVYVVAAGNDSDNASNYSPASEPSAITVSAIADFDGKPGGLSDQTKSFSSCTEYKDDSVACFSNYGRDVDIAAPGVSIYSTVIGGYESYSGTSMASPHVAGAAALIRSQDFGMTPGEVWSELLSMAVPQNSADGFTEDNDGYHEPFLMMGENSPPNPTPIANAGDDQNANEQSLVILDGTGSYDSEGESISYLWSQFSGDSVSLNNPTASAPSFTTPTVYGDDELVFSLVVNDGFSDSIADFVSVFVSNTINEAPTANAGSNQIVNDLNSDGFEIVTLDASASFDINNETLSFQWSDGNGLLNNDMIVHHEFALGTHLVTLKVTDPHGDWNEDAISVTVTDLNDPPVATNDNTLVDEAGSVSVDVLANDTDVDSTLTITSFTQPTHGTVSEVSGQLQYTHDGTENFSDSFTYAITDGEFTDVAIVFLTIQELSSTVTITEPTSGTIEGKITVSAIAENFSGLLTFWLVATDSYAIGTTDSPYTVSFHTKDYPPGDYLLVANDSSDNKLDSVSVNIPSKGGGGGSDGGPDCDAKPNHPKCPSSAKK